MSNNQNENQQQAEVKDKKSRLNPATRIAAIIGFCLIGLAALILIATAAVSFISSNNKVTASKVTAFKSENQISKKLGSLIKSSSALNSTYAKYLKGAVGYSSDDEDESSDSQAQNDSQNDSDYADTVKTDGKYIYFLSSDNNSKISIFSADGENSKFISEINIVNKEPETFVFKDFYLSSKKLIAIEEGSVGASGDEASTFTRVETFDLSDINKIKPTESFSQSGIYSSSKLADSRLCLTSVHHPQDKTDLPCFSVKSDSKTTEDKSNHIPFADISSAENPSESNFAVISEVDVNSPDDSPSVKALLGASGSFYGKDALYLTAYEYNMDLYEAQNTEGKSYTHLPVDITQVVKVELNKNLTFPASARISGYIDTSCSFDEKDGALRVVTASTLDNDRYTEAANIFVLDKKLNCVGKITDFSTDKSIKSVRYIDNTAYVLPYKADDALYTIDLSDNTAPKILGETEISGFSSTLVPVDDETLLSVGYYTAKETSSDRDGLRLVTFDISDKVNPKKLDEKVFKSYQSPAQSNLNALVINTERGDFTIPMIYGNYSEAKSNYDTKYGLLNFKIEKGKINVVQDYTSELFKDSADSATSVDRCIFIKNYMYLLGWDYDFYRASGNALIEAVKYEQVERLKN